MTLIDVTYRHHAACGCACYTSQEPSSSGMPDGLPEVPIINGIEEDAILDRILSMRRQEDAPAYRVGDYLSSLTITAAGIEAAADEFEIDIDADCRAKMAEWFYQLVEFCRVDRDNVALAMNYLDRFLDTAHTTGNVRARQCLSDRREYQLAAMACLFLAINLTETREMDTGLLVELSHGKYDRADFTGMATAIMTGLGWRLNGPTSLGFVNHLLGLSLAASAKDEQHQPKHIVHEQRECCRRASAARDDARLHELCRAQVELSVSDYRLSSLRTSDVAVAAVRNALEQARPAGLLSFLRSLDRADIEPFSAEVEQARTILKSVFASNVDGLRQVTSLLRLGEDAAAPASTKADAEDHHQHRAHVSEMQRTSFTGSARCVAEIAREIGEGETP